RTGEVIALASAPNFDPNDWVPFLPRAIWNTYTNEDIAPLQNRAVYGHFAPGSIFKIMVSVAGMEAGTLKTNELQKVEPNPHDLAHGAITVRGHLFKDTAPPGYYDFYHAFIKSSNVFFICNALLVGRDRI